MEFSCVRVTGVFYHHHTNMLPCERDDGVLVDIVVAALLLLGGSTIANDQLSCFRRAYILALQRRRVRVEVVCRMLLRHHDPEWVRDFDQLVEGGDFEEFAWMVSTVVTLNSPSVFLEAKKTRRDSV